MPVLDIVIDLILWLLGIFSVITWSILLFKLIVFTRKKIANNQFKEAFEKVNDIKELKLIIGQSRAPLCTISKAFITELEHFAYDQSLDTQSRNDMIKHSLSQVRRDIQIKLEAGLAALASIGSISTILGLLGTVWSIMNLLKTLSGDSGTGLEVVAGPIGDALITTAVGIIVAVPALLGHNFFARRVRLAMSDMERFSEKLQHLAIRCRFEVNS